MSLQLSNQNNEFCESIRNFLQEQVSAEYLRKRIIDQKEDSSLWSKFVALGIFEACSLPDSGIKLSDCCALIQDFAGALVPEPVSVQCLFGSYLLGQQFANNSKLQNDLASLLHGTDGVSISLAPNSIDSQEILFVPHNQQTKYVFIEKSNSYMLAKFNSSKSKKVKCIDLSIQYCEPQKDLDMLIELPDLRTEQVESLKALLVVNELAGILKKVVQITCEYAGTRKQFGTAIGSFQAVQHKLAEMKLVADSLESLALFAGWALTDSPHQADLAIQSALRFATNKSVETIEQAIQVHGGIGFTWEYELHLYLRRAMLYQSLWGTGLNADSLLSKFAN